VLNRDLIVDMTACNDREAGHLNYIASLSDQITKLQLENTELHTGVCHLFMRLECKQYLASLPAMTSVCTSNTARSQTAEFGCKAGLVCCPVTGVW
jgi:hypothetical protein